MGKKKKEGKREEKSLLEKIGRRLAEIISAREPAADAELAAAVGLPLEELGRQLERARQIRKAADPRAIRELATPLQMAFLLLAEEDGDEDLLGDLIALIKDAALEKEARRILHRLRSRGVRLEVSEGSRSSILDRRPAEESKQLDCLLSPLDGDGLRHVWMARYAPGGVEVFQFSVSDIDGLVDFQGGTIGRNRYRSLLVELLEGRREFFLEISYAEARKYLAQAAERSRAAGRALPEQYLQASATLPEAEDIAFPNARELFPREQIPGGLEARGAELFQEEVFSEWLPPKQVMQYLEQALAEVENMQVAIDDNQRLTQINRSIDKAIETLLEGEARQRWVERLLQMAVFLQRQGRVDSARIAAAAAWQLEGEGFTPVQSAFFSSMVRRVLKSPEQILAGMRRPPSPTQSSPGGEEVKVSG